MWRLPTFSPKRGYHRPWAISLLCSEWEPVGQAQYSRHKKAQRGIAQKCQLGLTPISNSRLYSLRSLHREPYQARNLRAGSMRPNLGNGFGLEMLSALITTQCGFPAVRKVSTTGTPEIGSRGSSRTTPDLPQASDAHTRQGPTCLTTV